MGLLAKETKTEKLLDIFKEVGNKMSVKRVCEETGISGYNSLKALFSYIRKAKHIPDENRIDVRIQDDVCKRIS